MTPAHSPDAAFNRLRVEQQLPRGHFVPFPPWVSGRLGTLGPRAWPKSHRQQSHLRYQALAVSITTPKPVGDNGQQAVLRCQPRLLKDTAQGTRWPSLPFSHYRRFSDCSVSDTYTKRTLTDATVTEAVAKINKVGTWRPLQEPQQTRLSLPTFREHITSGLDCCYFVSCL